MVRHHPAEDLLIDYATGALGEAEAIVVATHLALCPDCRASVGAFEAMGGAMLDEIAPLPVGAHLLDSVMARLDAMPAAEPPMAAPARRPAVGGTVPLIPQPLRGYLGGDVGDVAWRPVMRGLDEHRIACPGDATVRLMRIRAGVAMPQHTHHGRELTLVLAGGFTDATGHYLRGDLSLSDGSVDHVPTADDDGDCICVAVTDAPLRLTGRLGRLLNPFIRF
jgi:putative transcriptional regulator